MLSSFLENQVIKNVQIFPYLETILLNSHPKN